MDIGEFSSPTVLKPIQRVRNQPQASCQKPHLCTFGVDALWIVSRGIWTWPGGRDGGSQNCQVFSALHEAEGKCQEYFTKLQQQTSLLASSSDKNTMKTVKVTHKATVSVLIGKESIQDNNTAHNIERNNFKDNHSRDHHQLSVLLLTLEKRCNQ